MKIFQKWVFLLALAGQGRAADGGAPGNYTGAAANIEGKVIVAATGQPLSGVKLRLADTNDLRDPVLSGADGSFRMAGIVPGGTVITAVFAGEPVADWVAEDVPVMVDAGETRKDVLVRALKGGVAAITVLSRNGRRPLADVPVSFSSQLSPVPAIAVTGADGVARLRLLPDTWRISANKEGLPLSGGQATVTVVAGKTNTAEILADPVLKITGTVRDPGGAPAGGAEVLINVNAVFGATGLREVRTDTNGRYEISWQRAARQRSGLGANNSFYLMARSADRNLAVIRDIDENTTNLDLTLQPSVTISAKVADATGQPVTNVHGYASLKLGNRIYLEEEATPFQSSDARGQIEFVGMPQAESYSLQVFATGYGSMNQEMQMPDPHTNHLEFPTVVLPLLNQKLGGKFLDAGGQPVAGVIVQAVAFTNQYLPSSDKPDTWDVKPVFGRFQGSTQTDSQGRFFLDPVCEGPIQLNCNFQGAAFSAQTVGGNTNIVLRLNVRNADVRNNNVPISAQGETVPAANPVLKITGTVRAPSGAPAAGVLIRLWGDYVNQEEVKTDSDGRYSLNWRKQASAPQLVIIARDVEHNLAASHEIDDTTTNVDLSLEPGLTLSVQAQDVNGRPIPSATETLDVMGWNLSRIPLKADEQGLIEIKALPQGRAYSATITSRGYNVAKAQAPAEETQTTHFEFPTAVLRVADRELAGQVLGPEDKPFPKANVQLSGSGQASATAMTDDQGRFAFGALCEGTVRLFANGQVAGVNYVSGYIQAQSGATNLLIRFERNIPQGSSPGSVVNEAMVTNSGTVLDPSGAPVSGALVSLALNYGGSFEARSDAGGKFLVVWQDPNSGMTQVKHFLYVRDEARNLAASQDVEETATNLELRLLPGLTLSVKVQDVNGKPIPTATASLSVRPGTLSSNYSHGVGKADEQGLIEIRGLPRGRPYGLTIAAKGYRLTNLVAHAADTQTTRFEFPTVVLEAANRKIYGHVLTPDGKPVPEARVQLRGDGQKTATTTSDSQGHFAFYALSEGPVRVFANMPGPNGSYESGDTLAQAGDTNVLIRFGIDGINFPDAQIVTTSGTVLDSSGAPVSGAWLSLMPGSSVTSDAVGKYSITWQNQNEKAAGGRTSFPLMQYVLLGHDVERQLVGAVEIDGKATNVDLHLQPGLTLSGVVRDAGGQAVTNAVVDLLLCPPSDWRSVANRLPPANASAQGSFSISALPQGARYSVNVAANGYGSNTIPVPASDTQTTQLHLPAIVLKAANRQLAGQVIGLDEKPCSGAQVTMRGEGQPGVKAARTDSNGHFVIQAVCEGLVDVRAVLPASASNPRGLVGTVQANGGDPDIVVKLGRTNGVPAAIPRVTGQGPTNRLPPSVPLQP